MARYWSDGYKETDAVGQAAPYAVTVADAVRWDAKQDQLFYDKTATMGSENLLTSGAVALELQHMRQYVQEEGGKAYYVDILKDPTTGQYAYHSADYTKVLAAFEKGRTIIVRVVDTGEYAYLHSAGNNYFKFVLSNKTSEMLFNLFWLYETGEILYSELSLPTIHEWALQKTKPAYTYSEVGADRAGEAAELLKAHNVGTDAHADMRKLIDDLVAKFNALSNSDDTTLKQLEELMQYIDGNKDIIESITTNKVNVVDVVDNLVTNASNKPLSAAQGVNLRRMIEQVVLGSTNISTYHLKVTGSLSMGRAEGSEVGENSVALGDGVQAIGTGSIALGTETIAGSRAYYISALDFDNRKIYLSNTQVMDAPPTTTGEVDTSFETPAYEVGKEFNIIVPNNHYILCGTIESIKNNVVTYTKDSNLGFTKFMSLEELQERFGTTKWSEICAIDDYTFAVPSQPNIGIASITSCNYAEGGYNIAAGSFSHAEGAETLTAGNFGHAEGRETVAGYASHAEGYESQALGLHSHAEGVRTIAGANQSHAEGYESQALGLHSHAEGQGCKSEGQASHAEGSGTIAKGLTSHAEGNQTETSGEDAHAEGFKTKATANHSHAEGFISVASAYASHAEGYETNATNTGAHAEGYVTSASGLYSHAEGQFSHATDQASHAEGYETVASALASHAEGYQSEASGSTSHAEGGYTKATNTYSHAEGQESIANGRTSHAEGMRTIAGSNYQHVQGMDNIEDTATKYLHIVGNGSYNNRSNAHTVSWSGKAWYAGSVTSNGADYAEYFEWLDENPEKEDRVGLLVTLDGDKIKLANVGDEVLGIISGTAAVLGDNYECEWNGKYLTDDFGRIIYEDVEEFIDEIIGKDEEGNSVIEKVSLGLFKRPVLNPNYDSTQEYINRADRPEWDAVGMLGKLYVRDNGTCQVNGYVKVVENGVATASTEKTNIRVLSRVTDNVIKVLLK